MARRGIRPLRTIGLTLGAVVAVASFAFTSQVAFAYPTPTGHHDLDCNPGNVQAQFGSCSVSFTDQDNKGHAVENTQVCFSVNGPGSISPTCSTTDSKGVARATYYAGAYPADCANADKGGHVKLTIYGQEASGDTDGDAGAAATTVQLQCPKPSNGGGGGGGGGGACHSNCTDSSPGGVSACHDHCTGDNATMCHDHCTGNGDTSCHDHCQGDAATLSNCQDHCYDSSGHQIRAVNAAAILDPSAPSGPSGWVFGGVILAIAALLAVAVTGRLRLRRFRA